MAPDHGWLARVWASLPVRVIRHLYADDGTVMAGGVALFLLLGLLPTMTAVVSVYALAADPSQIPQQLSGLEQVVPRAVHELIVDQLQRAASRSSEELTFAVVGSVVLALWAARSSAGAMLAAINHVDGSPRRFTGWWWNLLVSFGAALGSILVAVFVLAMVVAMPAISHVLRPDHRAWVENLRWPATVVVVIVSLGVLYWLGTKHATSIRHVLPGALVATALMLAASIGLSYYVTEVSYGTVYGTFGSVLVVILWFYICSLAVLIGAVTNYELRPTPPSADAGVSAAW
ncbi:MAG: YihY/virulence factor BrkB family protein [Deltaproteobacteria bacterium]|nr:YihY/virulence factor BrkB family protein [Deltaproteobacteria bacterium]